SGAFRSIPLLEKENRSYFLRFHPWAARHFANLRSIRSPNVGLFLDLHRFRTDPLAIPSLAGTTGFITESGTHSARDAGLAFGEIVRHHSEPYLSAHSSHDPQSLAPEQHGLDQDRTERSFPAPSRPDENVRGVERYAGSLKFDFFK